MASTLSIKIIIVLIGITTITLALLFFKKKRKEIILVAFSIGIAIAICEVLLRIFLPQISNHVRMFEADPTLGWKFISNGKWKIVYPGGIRNVIEINSMGFRDHSPPADKKRKLLVLGDSFVSNISVKDDEVFTEVMEDQLQNYDVLNFGVVGYGQVQEYLLLQKWIKEIKPDVVLLIIYFGNDFIDNIGAYWGISRPYASLEGQDSVLVIHPESHPQSKNQQSDSLGIFANSHLNILLTRSLNKIVQEYDSSLAPPEFYSCQWPVSERQDLMFRIMGELLLKIANLGKENDVPVVFALAPSLVQIKDELWESFLKKNIIYQKKFLRSLPNDRLMEFSKRHDLLMLDLFPRLHQESKTNVNLYHPVEQHWTKEGNRVVANALIDYLESRSLID
jgi:hypothetical protein